ncbi:DUF2808 domain-containing protein [Trichothermofontia sp.]
MTTPQFQPAKRLTVPLRRVLASTLLSGSLVLLTLPVLASPVALRRFDRAPQLVRFQSTSTQTSIGMSTYQLVITVPADAGAPLQAIKISQPQNLEVVAFQPQQTRVFVGDAQTEIPLVSQGGPQPETGDFTLELHHPVQPGETVTITLTPKRNPTIAGIYLFGVTAYAAGDDGTGLFLGYGQLDFYAPNGG